ncbi:hypothetical protein N431DRAFT_564154 [Stipitochalara longipes BDJ]|nr:hypothetical protein N431DRAFT_564154 [Stipitochalara longipes BDJ]
MQQARRQRNVWISGRRCLQGQRMQYSRGRRWAMGDGDGDGAHPDYCRPQRASWMVQ